jgi:multiple sugar transport system permease protein
MARPGIRREGIARPAFAIIVAVLLIFVLFPIAWELRTSLLPQAEVYKKLSLSIPAFSFANYEDVWRNFNFARNFLNTLIVSAVVTGGTVASCSLAGFAFARIEFPGKNALFYLYMSTMMLPFAVTIVPSYFVIIKLGLANKLVSLILPFFFGNAVGTFLMRQYYLTQPRELLEAAFIDGASYWRIWTSIMIPLSVPTMATLGVISLQGQWNSLLWPLIVTQGDKIKTLAMGLSDFRLSRTVNMAGMAAAVMMGTLPMILILFIANKSFLKGIQLNGVDR